MHKIIDRHRHDARGRKAIEALTRESTTNAQRPATPAAMLIAEQDRQQLGACIAAALAHLPERYRVAIDLRLMQDLPRETCAESLSITVGTFDVLLFRAIRAFRKVFVAETMEASHE